MRSFTWTTVLVLWALALSASGSAVPNRDGALRERDLERSNSLFKRVASAFHLASVPRSVYARQAETDVVKEVVVEKVVEPAQRKRSHQDNTEVVVKKVVEVVTVHPLERRADASSAAAASAAASAAALSSQAAAVSSDAKAASSAAAKAASAASSAAPESTAADKANAASAAPSSAAEATESSAAPSAAAAPESESANQDIAASSAAASFGAASSAAESANEAAAPSEVAAPSEAAAPSEGEDALLSILGSILPLILPSGWPTAWPTPTSDAWAEVEDAWAEVEDAWSSAWPPLIGDAWVEGEEPCPEDGDDAPWGTGYAAWSGDGGWVLSTTAPKLAAATGGSADDMQRAGFADVQLAGAAGQKIDAKIALAVGLAGLVFVQL